MFSEFFGFKARELTSLPVATKYALEISNLLIVGSLLFCAYSAFYLLNLSTISITTAIIVTLFTIVILFCLQNLIVSASGMGCEKSYSENDPAWKPAKIRFYIFFIIALIFSQPLLLSLYSQVYEKEINQSIEEQRNLHQEFLENSFKEKEDEITAQLNSQHEIIDRLTGINSSDTIVLTPNPITINATQDIKTSRRKALLIGNQAYPNAPLVNPDKDAKDMSNALKEIGFNTVLVTDGSKSAMEVEINKYIESIQPGDISYFYYSGHGMQQKGQNYIIPVDYPNKNPIGINLILEGISKKKPAANVITIDACRSFSSGDNGGLASLEAGSSTYISLAAKPGQTASDGIPHTNGVYTGAILKHIKERVDIDSIFRKVIDEVTKATDNKQEPWINHNLHGDLILSAPEYKPNTLASNTLKNQLVQTNAQRPSREIGFSRGVTVEEEPSIDYVSLVNNHVPSCEQKASKLAPNAIRDFLINCNQKKLFQLEDKLADHKLATQKAIKQLNEDMLYTNPIAYTLSSDLYYLRKHPIFLILGTFVITILLLLGFLMREIRFKEMSAYEQLLNYYLRNFVSEKYKDVKNVASLFPHTPDEVLRNSTSSPYQYRNFEEERVQDNLSSSDFFVHLNKKAMGESV